MERVETGGSGVGEFAWEAGSRGYVAALYASPDGCIYAGGSFILAGSTPVAGFACWDGTKWLDPRGDDTVPEMVSSIVGLPDGTTYFQGRTGMEEYGPWRIFKRTDSNWSILPEPVLLDLSQGHPSVDRIAIHENGTLYAAGRFTGTHESPNFWIAQWDGHQWKLIGSGGDRANHRVLDMVIGPDGNLLVAGKFQGIDDLETSGLASWDGENWRGFGSGAAQVNAVAYLGDTLHIGGSFREVDGVSADFAAYWDGVEWKEMSGGATGAVGEFSHMRNGGLLVGGIFGSADGTILNGVALWKNGEWKSLDRGVSGLGRAGVSAFTEAEDGSIFIGGHFSEAGGIRSYNIARWIPTGSNPPPEQQRDHREPYPNPARHEIYIPAPPDLQGTVTMYDLLGRARSRHSIDLPNNKLHYQRVPTGGLPSGTYLVRVETSIEAQTYSIVVIH